MTEFPGHRKKMERDEMIEVIRLSEEVRKEMNKRNHLKWTYCSLVLNTSLTLIPQNKVGKPSGRWPERGFGKVNKSNRPETRSQNNRLIMNRKNKPTDSKYN